MFKTHGFLSTCSFCKEETDPKILHYFFQHSNDFSKVTQLSIGRTLKDDARTEGGNSYHFIGFYVLDSNVLVKRIHQGQLG